jgi:cytochrome c biogenesis protein CcmG/thiol:disulfide interchange protein DsbE
MRSVRRRIGPAIATAVLVALAGFVIVLAQAGPASNQVVDAPIVGKAAPATEGTTLAGSRFRLSDHRGQWVLVNFMASWCGACKIEHPELIAFSQRHATVGDASVVSIATNDTPSDAKAFFTVRGGDWPVITDDGLLATGYGLVKLPESYLVDPNGFVRVKFISAVTADFVDQQIQRLSTN